MDRCINKPFKEHVTESKLAGVDATRRSKDEEGKLKALCSVHFASPLCTFCIHPPSFITTYVRPPIGGWPGDYSINKSALDLVLVEVCNCMGHAWTSPTFVHSAEVCVTVRPLVSLIVVNMQKKHVVSCCALKFNAYLVLLICRSLRQQQGAGVRSRELERVRMGWEAKREHVGSNMRETDQNKKTAVVKSERMRRAY